MLCNYTVGSEADPMDRGKIRELVENMDEETETAFLEEIIRKRASRLLKKKRGKQTSRQP